MRTGRLRNRHRGRFEAQQTGVRGKATHIYAGQSSAEKIFKKVAPDHLTAFAVRRRVLTSHHGAPETGRSGSDRGRLLHKSSPLGTEPPRGPPPPRRCDHRPQVRVDVDLPHRAGLQCGDIVVVDDEPRPPERMVQPGTMQTDDVGAGHQILDGNRLDRHTCTPGRPPTARNDHAMPLVPAAAFHAATLSHSCSRRNQHARVMACSSIGRTTGHAGRRRYDVRPALPLPSATARGGDAATGPHRVPAGPARGRWSDQSDRRLTSPCPGWPPPRRRAWPPPGRPGSGARSR